MLVVLRWVGRLFKKEYRFLERYERSHPHFFWYVLIDAAVSVLLVFGGFQLYSSAHLSTAREEKLEHSGGVSMTATKLAEQVKSSGGYVYWLGPISGAEYSFNDSLGYAKIVTYFPDGASVNDVGKTQLIVETYATAKDLAAHIHSIKNPSSQISVIQNDRKIKYDAKDRTGMTVEITGLPQVIEVEYPKAQSESKLLHDAAALTLVK